MNYSHCPSPWRGEDHLCSSAMSLAQLGLVLLLSLGLEATPQNYPGMSQSTADWYIRRFNKMADLPEDPYEVIQMSGPPSSPPIYPNSKYAFYL